MIAAVQWALAVVALVLLCGLVAMHAIARSDKRREAEEKRRWREHLAEPEQVACERCGQIRCRSQKCRRQGGRHASAA